MPERTVTAEPATEEPRPPRRNSLGRDVVLFSARRMRGAGGAMAALLVMLVYLSLTQEFYLTKANILNVLAGNSALIIVAVGLTFIILSAGFDLSLGAIFAAAGFVAWRAIVYGLPPLAAVILGALAGAVLGGAVNGILIGAVRLNFFVVTLGTATLFGGFLNVISNGKTNTVPTPDGGLIAFIGNGDVLSVPFPIVLALTVLLIAAYILRFTSFGRAVYAVGGNPEAARLAGVNVSAVYISVYGIAGLLAGTAGVLESARLASASPTDGSSLALTAGAAVLLGGTSFFGGRGGVGGTLIGVCLIAFLKNGLGLMGVSAWWQGVVTGLVLILAVALDKLQSRNRV
ncbi:ABC transporter permease [Streptomyces sp. ISID311]|uniref:ABC transporter permease n=1 Tax=Streptomyces sp. ISID311 TaxID=2601673 RepID=UPI0011BD3AA8|nr:ABC transporter permease [Streptomyces sp. ISID311]TXC99894.1 ABC transporter permease [Streptomyces sp. ISID311]